MKWLAGFATDQLLASGCYARRGGATSLIVQFNVLRRGSQETCFKSKDMLSYFGFIEDL